MADEKKHMTLSEALKREEKIFADLERRKWAARQAEANYFRGSVVCRICGNDIEGKQCETCGEWR